jgi:ElaB/YqjD/DUF883 family membrane-anchored ribosome-binding protein
MSVEKTTAPRTVQDARRAVEQSRERIAATLDELEDRIVETKASIKRKADVARPAREAIQKAPLVAIGLAVAVGLFLGTRGGDDDEDEDGYGFEKDERRALEEWRKRRRKMLLEEAESDAESFEDEDAEPGPFGRLMRSVGREVAGVAIGIIAAEIGERLYGARAGGAESEVSDDASDEPYDGEYDDEYDDDYDEQ